MRINVNIEADTPEQMREALLKLANATTVSGAPLATNVKRVSAEPTPHEQMAGKDVPPGAYQPVNRPHEDASAEVDADGLVAEIRKGDKADVEAAVESSEKHLTGRDKAKVTRAANARLAELEKADESSRIEAEGEADDEMAEGKNAPKEPESGSDVPDLHRVREVAGQLMKTKGANLVKDLITRHGGTKVSDIPDGNRAQFVEECLQELEA